MINIAECLKRIKRCSTNQATIDVKLLEWKLDLQDKSFEQGGLGEEIENKLIELENFQINFLKEGEDEQE